MEAAAIIDDCDEVVIVRVTELTEATKDKSWIARENQVPWLQTFGKFLGGAYFLVSCAGVGRATR